MKALLIYPQFPKTFYSFESVLKLVDKKVLLPPLNLATVAALLPTHWELRLIDHNIREISESDWDWADMVMLTAMIVQAEDFVAQIREAKRRGKPVVVGGPYSTSVPRVAEEAGADFLVLDEGEVTIPMFLAALERGERQGKFCSRHQKPDVTTSPVPRFDLLPLDAYDAMSIQFSRGCPFLCEFCDIITLYGRVPRTKAPRQVLAELDCLYQLGWRRSIFLVDDNFVGNKHKVKELMRELRVWQKEHNYPFSFDTQASVDLAQDDELLDLMMECNFGAVFMGIETPDPATLKLTKKYQNANSSLLVAVEKLQKAGLRPIAGFIIGFDNEAPEAGKRLEEFVEAAAIPAAIFSMLQALPNTALWDRMEREGRLLAKESALTQGSLTNFVPTRPMEEIAREHVGVFYNIYDPIRYLERTYRCFLRMGAPRIKRRAEVRIQMPNLVDLRALAIVLWRQGMARKTRWRFWYRLVCMALRNPGVWGHFVTTCAHAEHYIEYREKVKTDILAQLDAYLANPPRRAAVA